MTSILSSSGKAVSPQNNGVFAPEFQPLRVTDGGSVPTSFGISMWAPIELRFDERLVMEGRRLLDEDKLVAPIPEHLRELVRQQWPA